MSIALSFVADIALILLGGKLKRRERLSARLGDVLSYLYLGSAVLKYYNDFGDKKQDVDYVHWCLKNCLYQIQEAFLNLFRNFPIPFLRGFFRFIIFPFGRAYLPPGDLLEHNLASSMMLPSVFRDRLIEHCYLSKANNNPITNLEFALKQVIASEKVTIKLEEAIKKGLISKMLDTPAKIEKALACGILTTEEGDLLQMTEKACLSAISVDEFSKEQLIGA